MVTLQAGHLYKVSGPQSMHVWTCISMQATSIRLVGPKVCVHGHVLAGHLYKVSGPQSMCGHVLAGHLLIH